MRKLIKSRGIDYVSENLNSIDSLGTFRSKKEIIFSKCYGGILRHGCFEDLVWRLCLSLEQVSSYLFGPVSGAFGTWDGPSRSH